MSDDWVRERAARLLNSNERGISGTAIALESLEMGIAVALQEAIDRTRSEERALAAEEVRRLNLHISCHTVGCQAWALMPEVQAAEAKLDRLRSSDDGRERWTCPKCGVNISGPCVEKEG